MLPFNDLKSWLGVPVEASNAVARYDPKRAAVARIRQWFTPKTLFNTFFLAGMLLLIGAAFHAPTIQDVQPCVELCPVDNAGLIPPNPNIQSKTPNKEVNEAAPIAVKQVQGEYAQLAAAYIKRYYITAQAEQAKFGIPASISLAQGLIESRAGTSTLARKANNHFGVKCFSKKCRKGHCMNVTDDSHKDFFVKYSKPWWSWRDHSNLLSSGRYKVLHKHGINYKKWAYGLENVGYATDDQYAEKLIGVIEAYGLHRYD